MRVPRSAFLLVLLFPWACAEGAWMDFGPAAPGESKDLYHEGWIEVKGFSTEAAAPKSGSIGGFSFLKLVDKASPKLAGLIMAGTKVPEVKLHLASSTANGGNPFYLLDLEDVVITSLRTSSSAAMERPEEKVSIAFRKITYTYVPPRGSAITVDYDYATQQGGGGDGDQDGDGMPDAWEELHGLNVNGNDAAGDADGDGLSNLNEYLLGTDPKSGTSFFKATLAASSTESLLDLSWNTVSGKVYLVQWTADLNTPFSTMREVTATGATSSIQVDRSSMSGFYRVTLKP